MGLDRACYAGQERAAGECEELQPEDVDAHGLGGLLVLSDGHPATANAGVVEPDEHQNDKRDQHQQQEVVVGEAAERDTQRYMRLAEVEAEKNKVGNRGNAVGSVRNVRAGLAVQVDHGNAEDLTERQRHDGQVVTGHPQCR